MANRKFIAIYLINFMIKAKINFIKYMGNGNGIAFLYNKY